MATMLTTIDTVKMQLGITGTAEDDRLDFIVKAVSAAIESYCKRAFGKTDYEHTFYPTYNKYLYLEEYPIREVQKVTLGDDELDATDYKVQKGRLRKKEGTWNKEVIVEYTAGYVLPGDEDTEAAPPIIRDLPYDLEAACTYYATVNYNTSASAGYKSERVDVLQVNYHDVYTMGNHKLLPMPAAAMAIVDPYRHGGRFV